MLTRDNIILNFKAKNKSEVINYLCDRAFNIKAVSDKDKFVSEVFARESEISTGLGGGIGIPHAQSEYVKKPTVIFGRSEIPIDYDAIDGKKCDLFFLIAVPNSASEMHLKTLQNLSRKLVDDEVLKQLRQSNSEEDIVETLNAILKDDSKNKKYIENSNINIVAIANCPAGIAHTYMVAEKLESKAAELGYNIKVETQGASGVENRLSNKDIENADYVILALGKGMTDDDRLRFNDKNVLNIKISEAMKNIDRVFVDLEKNTKKFHSGVENTEINEGEPEGIFLHLMNGISYVIPYVVAGGLLLSLGTILEPIANSIDSEILERIVSVFYTVGVYGFTFMIPILGAYIAYSISDKPALAPAFLLSYLANDTEALGTEAGAGFLGAIAIGLLVGYVVKHMKRIKVTKEIQPLMSFLVIPFVVTGIGAIVTLFLIGPLVGTLMGALSSVLVNTQGTSAILTSMLIGGMIAFDAGGPVNKTAFLFAFGLVSEGIYTFYGVVAVGVIVPTLAVGIACHIYPKLFSNQEIENGKAAIISASFGIGEPGIPYIVADPLPMISANVLTGIFTGFMAAILNIQRVAPGPGIFEPIFGITTPALAFYLTVILGIVLNIFLIYVFKRSFGKNAMTKRKHFKLN